MLKLERSRTQNTLAFHQITPHPSLTYLDTQQINGIDFKKIQTLSEEVCKQILGFSKTPEITPISKLELERLVKEKNETIKSSLGVSIEIPKIPDLPNQMGVYKQYLLTVLQLLEEIQQDQLGRQAPREKVEILGFDFTREKNHVTLKKQFLNVCLNLDELPKKAMLKKAIEDVL